MELPLRLADLGVGAGDLDVGVDTRAEVSLDNIALDDTAGTHTTVIWPLGSREAVLGPAKRPVAQVQESVLLLETEPGDRLGMCLHELGALMAVVVLVRGPVVVPALGQDTTADKLACYSINLLLVASQALVCLHIQNVVALPERVGVDGNRAEVDIGVLAGSLAGGTPVEVPDG